jgi:hypothetical protein
MHDEHTNADHDDIIGYIGYIGYGIIGHDLGSCGVGAHDR